MQILRMSIDLRVKKDAKGDFRINPDISAEFDRLARVAFSDSFKPRTLILLVYNAPYFVHHFLETNVRPTILPSARKILAAKGRLPF